MVVLKFIRGQISVFIPTLQLAGELCIIHYNYREELVLAKLTWYILEICDQLFICLVFNLSFSLIRLSDHLFSQAGCVIAIKGDFVAEDETVCGVRVGQMLILGILIVGKQLIFDSTLQDPVLIRV